VPSPLAEFTIADRAVRIVATDRADGDVHPGRVSRAQLTRRQVRATGRPWVMLDEVHGVDVVEVSPRHASEPLAGVGDVMVTRDADLDLAVWTADCAPIFLLADDGTTVGAHAGWRGLVRGVVDVAVDAARRDGGRVVGAVLGPVIGPCCYAFGADDLAGVAQSVHSRPEELAAESADGRLALDMARAVRSALAHHDIELDAVGPCTGCDERWFSHRARTEPGRQATVASIGSARP
jgi:YfiH family protein